MKTSQDDSSVVVLSRRRIYILPTKHGLIFALMMFALLIGATNYDNSLAYLLTFALVSVGLVSLLHTYRNLAGLRLRLGNMPQVFAGDVGEVPLLIENSLHRTRIAVDIQHPAACPDEAKARSVVRTRVDAKQTSTVLLPIRFFTRGEFPLARTIVSTRFPFGIFRAWAYVDTRPSCLVFPCAAGTQPLPQLPTAAGHASAANGEGGEDFSGLREYQRGDSPRGIHWKAVARGNQVPVKVFNDGADYSCVLDWQLIADNDMEKRLEQLCAWVVSAEAGGYSYALILPDIEIAKGSGTMHRERCLRALATTPRTPGTTSAQLAGDGKPDFWRRLRWPFRASRQTPALNHTSNHTGNWRATGASGYDSDVNATR